MRKLCALFVVCFISFPLFSQQVGKLSPTLQQELAKISPVGSKDLIIALSAPGCFEDSIVKLPGVIVAYRYPGASVYVINVPTQIFMKRIVPLPEFLFADLVRIPREEVAVSNLDLSVNRVTTMHRDYLQFIGNGIHVSVKENRPDTADIDFKGRFIPGTLMSPALSAHATIMSTIIAGGGNTYYEGKGVAPAATFSSVNFANLLPEPDSYYQSFNVSVQNHSYGTGIENYYGADAVAYDVNVNSRQSLVHVFSAGNSGQSANTSGIYSGITGYANITGSFKMAKNVITVGHTDSTGVVLPPSSRGPGYDGRLLPGLVAFGEDGSSGAAAIVSGIAADLQQAYKAINGGLPSSAWVRAVLYNSADDAGSTGIDYRSGYGRANAWNAMNGLLTGSYFNGSVVNGGQQEHHIIVPPSIKQVKITLAWNDSVAAANAAASLVNDLDLELVEVSTSTTWHPWVLSSFPHPDSLAKLPVRRKDSRNNAEQITVDLPVAGNYRVVVKGFNVQGAAQNYSVAYAFDTLDHFAFQYPTATDNIFGGRTNMIRWRSGFPGLMDSIQYTLDNGGSWQTIGRNISLADGYYRWNAPDTFTNAQLRVHIGNNDFTGERFTISNRFNLNVGFNCPDSFSFHWQRIPGVDFYRVFRLGAKYMEPVMDVTDTFFVLQKATNPSRHYAVAPVFDWMQGVRSYAYDYSTQGVGCYVKSFLVGLSGQNGLLDLELGTSYGVYSIAWEKLGPAGFSVLDSTTNINGTTFQYTDQNLVTGMNVYRVRIRLMNGQVIYSSQETIYFFGKSPYIVYPNPALSDQVISILNNEPDVVELRIFNAMGMEVYRRRLDFSINELPVGFFRTGMYVLQFIKMDGSRESVKLLIQ